MSQNQGGDSLARGCVRFQFQPAGSKVSQEKWNDIFAGFDPAEYRRNADAEKTGNAGAESGETGGGTVRI